MNSESLEQLIFNDYVMMYGTFDGIQTDAETAISIGIAFTLHYLNIRDLLKADIGETEWNYKEQCIEYTAPAVPASMSEAAKEAKRAYGREYYRKNKEKINAYSKKYRQGHAEQLKANCRNYWERKAQQLAKEEKTP